MYVDERKNKNGSVTYRFTYVDDDGKRRRLPQSQVPQDALKDRASAEAWARTQEGIRSSQKAEHLRKLAWRTQYYAFDELLQKYEAWQKQRAPNSWKSCVFYLEHWVFPFFLQEKQSGNVNNWYLHFQEFRDWLGKQERKGKPGLKRPRLAISTQNNITKALNTFLQCLGTYNIMDPQSVRKCSSHPQHLVASRDMTYVISTEERDRICSELARNNPGVADFFLILWHTGMRFSELFGLPITALYKGDVPAGPLRQELQRCQISYYGYLYLESQPEHDDRRRAKDGSIARKPLKSCRTISPKYARTIPIRSKDVWNILFNRHKNQTELLLRKKYGSEKKNYVFFDDLEWNRTVNSFRSSQEKLGMEPRGYHACRHSYTTNLVGETGSYVLVRMITGHRSQGAFERYLHVWEQANRAAQQNNQELELIV